ncbi:hypothetical protein H257_17328 [Aphanomyces astaci]|uniref:Uncharacterized protein n=1 Tax=Aphanomyces astaci TaxID=112090 RepID=W4FH45_APHAT|nr:hypothetical protein H257_17328 [Aphanomyces astaci]ETV66184.1 hypothetical protein H257_17328 [Aphanomyces astaci]|eukprot:XP_009844373.1 hypothetical protein H257_17328 [Aphanomyces astaci]
MMEASRWKALRYYSAMQDKTAVVTLSKGHDECMASKQIALLMAHDVGPSWKTLLGLMDMKSPLGVYPRAVVKAEDVQRWEVDLSKEDVHRLLQLT